MINALVFLVLGLVGEATFLLHSRDTGRRHDAMVARLLRANAALTAALVHKDGSPVASAIVQTFTDEAEAGDSLRDTAQAESEASSLMGFN